MTSVLVGADGSEAAAAAVGWAAGAAKALGAELIVATAVRADAPQSQVDDIAQLLEARWCSPAREAGPALRLVLLRGDPREALVRASGDDDVDLTVLGSTGTGWYPAVHLGSVGHHLAEHGAGPVAIIPPAARDFHADRITLGVDGSAGSLAARDWCDTLATHTQAAVTIVYAHLSGAQAGSPVEEPGWRDQAQQRCREWASPLDTTGQLAGVEIAEGDPAKALIEAAARHASDLMVVGTRGAGGFHDLRLGSVALKLLHHATRPTVVVPPARD